MMFRDVFSFLGKLVTDAFLQSYGLHFNVAGR